MKIGKKLSRCFPILLLVLFNLAAIAQTSVGVGLGGGGSIFAPAISPFDPKTMFVACDQSGLYRSTDGGLTWTMLDGRVVQGSIQFSVAFDPGTPNRVLGFRPFQGLKESTDNGITWNLIAGPFNTSDLVVAAAYTGNSSMPLLVATGKGIFGSSASGAWTQQTLPTLPSVVTQNVLKIISVANPSTSQHDLFAAVNGFDNATPTPNLLTSDIYKWNGTGWSAFETGLPGGFIISDLAGASNASKYALHIALGSNGIYRLESGAAGWVSANGNLTLSTSNGQFQYAVVAMAASDPDTVHAATAKDCPPSGACGIVAYKGTFTTSMNWASTLIPFQNASNTLTPGWIEVAEPQDNGWGFGLGGPAHGMAAAQPGATTVIFSNNAAVLVSQTAGAHWTEQYTRQITAGTPTLSTAWQTIGLDVTTTWNYVIHPDPSKSNIRFIPNTDIGLSRSEDGSVWTDVSPMDLTLPQKNKWNNFYQLAFEYPNGSRIWAGLSHEHDIPYESELDDSGVNPSNVLGAVYVSGDDGKTWTQEVTAGLPSVTGPVVSVIYDPTARIVYASIWRNGVYKLVSGATSWSPVGSFPANTHVYQLAQDSSGSLYVSVVGSVNNKIASPGALYKFDGTTWQPTPNLTVTGSVVVPTNFAFDPGHPGDIYLATESVQGSSGGGGIYKLSAGAWTNMNLPIDPNLHDSLVVYAPVFINNRLYATTVTEGTYALVNGAWQKMFNEVPFIGTQRLVLDNGNLPLASSTTFDTVHFTSSSFAVANPVSTSSSSASVATTGTFTINGTEQGSASGGTPATAGTGGQIAIGGTEQTFHSGDFVNGIGFDDGSVSVTVGSFTASVQYGKGSTSATVATGLINGVNGNAASPVTATAVGTTGMSFNSKTTGAGTNYPVNVSSVTNEGLLHPSFSGTPAATALTGGSNGTPGSSLFDQGTVTLNVNANVNAHGPYTVSYGQSSTGTTIASSLASLINTDGSAVVTATASGNTVTVIAKQTGKLYISTFGGGVQKTNPPAIAVGSVTINGNEQSVLTGGTPGAAGSGGLITITGTEQTFRNTDFVGIQFDTGNVNVTVGGFTATVLYARGSSAASVASGLISIFSSPSSSPVTAIAVGTTGISFVSKATGANTNYAVSVTSASDVLAGPSFRGSPANTALSGGTNGQAGSTIFDQGTVTITVTNPNTNAITNYPAPYGQGSTGASIAQTLTNLINNDLTAVVVATASGNVVNLMGKASSPLYPITATTTFDSAHFSVPSFPPTATGLTLQ